MEYKYYELRPEVPGGLGEGTLVDNSVFPPKIENLHFVFEGWLGDELITTFPCYLATISALDAMKEASLTGYVFKDVKVSYSPTFLQLYPDRRMPIFKQLIIVGERGQDFYINNRNSLMVSQRALEVLETNTNLDHCRIDADIE